MSTGMGMSGVLWLATSIPGTLLVLWRRFGDRWGWLGMLNSWAEWTIAALGATALLSALARRPLQCLTALMLLARWGKVLPGQTLPAWLPSAAGEGTITAAGQRATTEEEAFTLFSANLYRRTRDATSHIELVQRHRPDIICLQELTPPLARQFLAVLGEEYPFRVWRPLIGSYGFGVLSRFPVEETGHWDDPGNEPWALRVRCLLPHNKPVEIYTVHLLPPLAESVFTHGMTWGFRGREEQVGFLQREIRERGLPACIVGDCNFTESSDVYAMACSEWTDGWIAAGEGARWTWPTRDFPVAGIPWAPPMLRLDYCFHNDEVRAESMRVMTHPTGSDHYPLLVRLVVA